MGNSIISLPCLVNDLQTMVSELLKTVSFKDKFKDI